MNVGMVKMASKRVALCAQEPSRIDPVTGKYV